MRVPIFGHRGFRGRLENTVPAFRRALRYAEGVEFDVRLTADGKAVVHHDPSFRSGGEFYTISELRFRELRRLHPLGKLIPAVEDLFRKFNGALFNADVKVPHAVETLLDLVERFKLEERVVFSSENPEIVGRLLEECPDCRVGLSIVGYPSVIHLVRLRELYSVHVPIDAVSYIGFRNLGVLLKALRKRGLRIYLWNYEMDELMWVPRLLPLTDAVISDDPARLKKVLLESGMRRTGGERYGGLE